MTTYEVWNADESEYLGKMTIEMGMWHKTHLLHRLGYYGYTVIEEAKTKKKPNQRRNQTQENQR